MNERFIKCHVESRGLGVKHVTKSYVKNDIGGTEVNVTLLCILFNSQIRLFSAPSENRVPPSVVRFPVPCSPSVGRLPLSGFPGLDPKQAPSPGWLLRAVRHKERHGGLGPFL